MKDSGLYHLDERDRSLSNVGDDLEDILEFFAGIDILFLLFELAISVGTTAPWLPIFIILIPLGPLFSIVLNFTLIFMYFKNKATSSMLKFLDHQWEIPDMISAPNYIRSRVLALVDRELLAVPPVVGSNLSPPQKEETPLDMENEKGLATEEDDPIRDE